MDEIDAFIRDYSTTDRDRIVFASNGKLGAELRDANNQHRSALCDRLRKTGASPASDELIRELYDAETAWAKAAWCVRHVTVSFLAAELLTRGGEKNLRHYLECCMFRGMDAYMSSLCVRLARGSQQGGRGVGRVNRFGRGRAPVLGNIRDSLLVIRAE